MPDFIETLKKEIDCAELSFGRDMSRETTLRIGGPAKAFIDAASPESIAIGLAAAREYGEKTLIMGNGSNLLIGDKGFDGLIIRIKDGLSHIGEENGLIIAEAGAPLSRLGNFAADGGLAGLEFAAGIPGTVGGGVYMNAGAYGGEIKDTLISAKVLRGGEIVCVSAEDMDLSYRHSAFMGSGGVIISACFRPGDGDPEKLREKIREQSRARREKQPLDLPSAGSAFKRPVGGYAAALIEQAGLKGYAVGGAAVSEKHSGFIVNKGGASAADVRALIAYVQDRVFENSGIRLEPEIQFAGEF